MLKATKVRIYPTSEQAEFLNAQFGAVRFAYNKALHIKRYYYRRYAVNLSPLKDIKPLLAVAKGSRKYHWLREYDSIALQESVRNLNKAFNKFFDPKDPARFPRFKSKYGRQSSYHCTCVSLVESGIKIPKLKAPVAANLHRKIEGKVKSITLSRTVTGKYYASILVENGLIQAKPVHDLHESNIVGVDVGLTHLLINSTAHREKNPRFTRQAARNLKRKQQALSRTKKGSKGRAKARLIVAKCHENIANARNDFQHKLSKRLIDENQAIVVETLKVKNMLKHPTLAKHIADASWSSLIAKLEYKAKDQGKHLVKINQWYASSKTCNHCGHKVKDLPLSVRKWDCPSCKVEGIDRDINAALNIKQQGILKLKAAGLVVSANGGLRKSAIMSVAA